MTIIMRKSGQKRDGGDGRKALYTWSGCGLVIILTLVTVLPNIGAEPQPDYSNFSSSRMQDLAALPFGTDAEEADFLRDNPEYKQLSNMDLLGSLFSSEDRKERQIKDQEEGTPPPPDPEYKEIFNQKYKIEKAKEVVQEREEKKVRAKEQFAKAKEELQVKEQMKAVEREQKKKEKAQERAKEKEQQKMDPQQKSNVSQKMYAQQKNVQQQGVTPQQRSSFQQSSFQQQRSFQQQQQQQQRQQQQVAKGKQNIKAPQQNESGRSIRSTKEQNQTRPASLSGGSMAGSSGGGGSATVGSIWRYEGTSSKAVNGVGSGSMNNGLTNKDIAFAMEKGRSAGLDAALLSSAKGANAGDAEGAAAGAIDAFQKEVTADDLAKAKQEVGIDEEEALPEGVDMGIQDELNRAINDELDKNDNNNNDNDNNNNNGGGDGTNANCIKRDGSPDWTCWGMNALNTVLNELLSGVSGCITGGCKGGGLTKEAKKAITEKGGFEYYGKICFPYTDSNNKTTISCS